MPADATGRLFARGLDEITDLYIEPVSNRKLVLAGAARLARLDSKFRLAESPAPGGGTALVLSYDGREVGLHPAPAEDAGHDWGEVVSQLIGDAKRVSPKLATLSDEELDKAVFDGMTGTLDRFSRYASPETARDQRAARDGFGGIGITLDATNDELRVTAVSPHGPADRAGIKAGDKLLAVDGMTTAGRSQTDVIRQLRGPIFSTVEVTIARGAVSGTRRLKLQRELIVMPTVKVTRDGQIAVIQIASFNQNTTQRVVDSLQEAQRQAGSRLAGVVLDLRSNPGGLLDQAVSLADVFVREGPIVSTVGRHPASRQFFAATGDGIAPRLPVVVLIDGGSASAAEIVAAALQDRGRAVVIGSSSYGKGTVQTVVRLPNDGELTLTWARLVAPSGYLLNQHGVVPTLCTSDLGDDDRSLQLGLQRASRLASARQRAGLDEPGWSDLRGSCPGRHGEHDIDLKLAERVLQDPALYAQTVHAAAGQSVATTAPQAATIAEPALTGVGGALSSGIR